MKKVLSISMPHEFLQGQTFKKINQKSEDSLKRLSIHSSQIFSAGFVLLGFFFKVTNIVRGSESTKLILKNIHLFGTSQKSIHTKSLILDLKSLS